MHNLVKVMKALSDPTRIRIVKMLQHKTLCVCEMQAALEHSQPNVSKHLRILQEAGLVQSHKDGLWVNYTLASGDGSSPYARTLLGNMKDWLKEDPEVKVLLEKIRCVDRSTLCPR
ncbi:MAG: winged helix-turn-helix transcriptional regulator [Desulfosarcina sp.]|nr:winged helix-turn-helix transcriptional regulator [Desulfobacterales bacterium]